MTAESKHEQPEKGYFLSFLFKSVFKERIYLEDITFDIQFPKVTQEKMHVSGAVTNIKTSLDCF